MQAERCAADSLRDFHTSSGKKPLSQPPYPKPHPTLPPRPCLRPPRHSGEL
ncbi:Far upstream element-binding protein 3 [Clarias magur]|uniref:Far upstream element-binding protein 3 n=1 Tax=Clarias magur TaxID=1594786 RepID=A0A8J4U197_CLAMG|nr:Far upstream element-binding protein 3 [Clarias magur]